MPEGKKMPGKSRWRDDFAFKMTALLGIVLTMSVLVPLLIHELFPNP